MSYQRQIETAKRLISEKGVSVTWRRIAAGSPVDSDKPWLPTDATTVDTSVTMVFLPNERVNFRSKMYKEETETKMASFYGLMASVSFDPDINDCVIDGNGKELKIKAIDVLAPAGEPILYWVFFE